MKSTYASPPNVWKRPPSGGLFCINNHIAFFSLALMLPDNLSQALLRNFTTYANFKNSLSIKSQTIR
ncbi:hypothetical protein CGK36_13740, partial [Vibrio parahaemolyticus]|uniref:hypothetical protein n=1 Tax=Vibrio parahaemolyticus TaxID=670 RepID=UPI00117182E0